MNKLEIQKKRRQAVMQELGISRSKMIELEKRLNLTKYKFGDNDRVVFYDFNEVMAKLRPEK